MKLKTPTWIGLVNAPWALTALLSLACDGGGGGTSSTTEAHADGSETGEPTTTTVVTASGPGASSSEGSSDEAPTQTTGETSETSETSGTDSSNGSSGTSTGDDGSQSLDEACQKMCEKAVYVCDIGFPVGVKSCVSLCDYSFGEDVGACGEAAIDYVDCMATLECDPLLSALTDGEPGACADAGAAYNDICP